MINILIVEDEPLVRLGIRTSLLAHPDVISIEGEAENGLEALELLRKNIVQIDAVLTDIRMPGMDGLELTKIIKKDYPEIKVIILSSHNDFHYVKDAVQSGASDYLLKNEVDENNILIFFEKIFGTNLLNSGNKNTSPGTLHQRKKIVSELLPKLSPCITSNYDDIDYSSGCKKISLALRIRNFNSLIKEVYKSNLDLFETSFFNVINEYLRQRCGADYFKEQEGLYIIFLETNGPDEDCVNATEILGHLLKKYLNIKSDIGVSSTFLSESEIPLGFSQAKAALKACFYFHDGNSRFVRYKELEFTQLSQLINESLANILDLLTRNEINKLWIQIDKLFSYYQKSIGIEPKIAKSQLSGILNEIYERYKTELLSQGVHSKLKAEREVQNAQSIFEIKDYFQTIITSIESSKQYKNQKKNIHIKKAIEIINSDFHDQKINLEYISTQLHLNPSYFSRLFKSELGMGFIEYLTKKRIDFAEELIRNGNCGTLHEVCEKSGFSNYNHFCNTFKKYTGHLPSDH